MTNEAIIEMLREFEEYSKALKKHLFKLCWHMRGGVSLDEIFQLGPSDRSIIEDIVQDNIKITNETRIPFF